MGIGQRGNLVYVIDFGLAKKFRDPATNLHIPYRDKKRLTGTARYTSINSHLGVEQSRRDDLESLAYVLLYFLRGSLPWQGIGNTNKRKYNKVMQQKMTTPSDELCHGFPREFAMFLQYARSLRFNDRPDYSFSRKLFRDLFIRQGFQYDYIFDWSLPQRSVEDDPNSKQGGWWINPTLTVTLAWFRARTPYLCILSYPILVLPESRGAFRGAHFKRLNNFTSISRASDTHTTGQRHRISLSSGHCYSTTPPFGSRSTCWVKRQVLTRSVYTQWQPSPGISTSASTLFIAV